MTTLKSFKAAPVGAGLFGLFMLMLVDRDREAMMKC
jgi:hypothetical protein